jgi:predicted dehydrogenase
VEGGVKVIIVGLGYAGGRFLRALRYVEKSLQLLQPLDIAYVARNNKHNDLQYFNTLPTAMSDFCPDIVIVAVNDDCHAQILNQLNGFKGFVICEKPLANRQDDLLSLQSSLKSISGFCFDLIERYSQATVELKKFVEQHNLKLIRANFHWGKNRICDCRPTAGVTSEVIHALDIIRYIKDDNANYNFSSVAGCISDFSISGDEVLDSVSVTSELGGAIVTGYSSFVNILRKREIDLTFMSLQHQLVYAKIIYDTPEWDIDHLRVWESSRVGETVHLEINTQNQYKCNDLCTIGKLSQLVTDVLLFVQSGVKPEINFPCLEVALQLQHELNEIDLKVAASGPVRYIASGKREFLVDRNDLERMG